MSTKITHAVIPVAGFGTRMLPLSKAVPKELLPLGNKPAIQYVVEEAIAAGLTNIVLVNHAQKTAIENYFDINSELDTQLRAKGKVALADSLNWLPAGVTVTTGSATPASPKLLDPWLQTSTPLGSKKPTSAFR